MSEGESEENYNFIVGDVDLYGRLCQEGSPGALGFNRT